MKLSRMFAELVWWSLRNIYVSCLVKRRVWAGESGSHKCVRRVSSLLVFVLSLEPRTLSPLVKSRALAKKRTRGRVSVSHSSALWGNIHWDFFKQKSQSSWFGMLEACALFLRPPYHSGMGESVKVNMEASMVYILKHGMKQASWF